MRKSIRFLVGLMALGLMLTMGLAVQSGTIEQKLPAWAREYCPMPPAPKASEPPAPLEPPRVLAEGRVVAYPGAEVVVGSEARGRIVRLPVREKSTVRAGDLIAELNADDLRAELSQARARGAEADADLTFFDREIRREEALIARRAGTSQNLDAHRRGLDAARARRLAATADAERIQALLAKARILAPIDGVVIARHVHPGETVDIASKVVTIADLSKVRVEAEVDEFDTGRIHLGAAVRITSEGYPGRAWRGTAEEVPDTVVSRRIRPEDPGRPIDARVLPLKVRFDGPTPLKLGQRVEVEVEVEGDATPEPSAGNASAALPGAPSR